VGHSVLFNGEKNIIHFTTRFGAIISCMFRPLIQLEINRLDNFETTHAGKGLDEVTRIALSHMTPLVLNRAI
jgi:hypothetical protein